MSWGLLNAAMLLGSIGAAIPVIIHLLNRRRDQVIDWGAMQFLELGQRARRKIRLTELLLMLARMGLLALVALALARPFWAAGANTRGGLGREAPPRDVVLVIDGSAASMEPPGAAARPRAPSPWRGPGGSSRRCGRATRSPFWSPGIASAP